MPVPIFSFIRFIQTIHQPHPAKKIEPPNRSAFHPPRPSIINAPSYPNINTSLMKPLLPAWEWIPHINSKHKSKALSELHPKCITLVYKSFPKISRHINPNDIFVMEFIMHAEINFFAKQILKIINQSSFVSIYNSFLLVR
ncbi:hypothetical protein EYC80_007773 [Monilinia laxa]|uniref:Uncharacterized protein n=1 Tax=Monilinia laxa TaxID=61186 RepID=A0A5N6JWY5_MONLA|nr:hypothetical protein EYC80_007773 [Monilinia laxa]